MLDTDTQVSVAEGSSDRKLTLAHGKLFVEVVRNGNIPLLLKTAGLAMEMAEGAFSLQAIPDLPFLALVVKGEHAVTQHRGLFEPPRRLELWQDRELSLAAGADLGQADVRPVTTARQDELLAWRKGMLSFGGEALATAVRAFDRYGPIRIVITDSELGSTG